ncbi:hypothetical protein E2493_12430 [Sphingomonas parva]|uniref:Lipoprotein n=1 Tax=Sphingomonas parva TaxID=2555898 RepID=A0A4Y8ZU60_9SPHN|nr:hypothetical protein [Sphingomonas parva]TFI57996.1 hypothetical protein E2493_12430 [Sphingomonas parva]
MRLLPLLPCLLLAGCAGYAADYWRPKSDLIAAQLPRYGMSGEQGQCVEAKLTAALTVWQLRQLSDLASRLEPGGRNPEQFGPRDFLHIAGLVEDAKVQPEAQRALQACGLDPAAAGGHVAATEAAPQPSAAAPTETTAAAATATAASEPLWVNLGAAQSGQGIAVDASSVSRGPGWRQAWFRLLNSDRAGVGDIGYLLRIDCASRNITAHAGRKYDPAGALTEQKDYPTPEGPMGIETGTVIEVAYHALCDDPR